MYLIVFLLIKKILIGCFTMVYIFNNGSLKFKKEKNISVLLFFLMFVSDNYHN